MIDINAMIERWKSGDERAAEALYHHFSESTFRLAYALLGNAADAEEAAQDALTYALVKIHRYDSERAAFGTWLHTITVSRCRDRQRRKRLARISLGEWLGWGRDLPDPAPGPESQVVQNETRHALLDAVQALSPSLREAIVLRYGAGHTFREIAEIMDCPAPTAQSRVRLAYKQLRQTLGAGTEPFGAPAPEGSPEAR